jgi:NADH-quinone oxidoreductase subunit M
MPLFVDAIDEFSLVITLICLASVIYGSLIALVQSNLYKLLSYGTVAHLGVIVMALSSLDAFGLYGGMLGILGLGITAVGLFFVSNFIYSRTNNLETNNDHYRLFRSAPLLAIAFIALVIGNIGLPGTIGFNAEHSIILGGLSGNWFMLLIATLGILLSAGYFLMYFKRALLDTRIVDSSDNRKFIDLKPRELFIALIFLALVYVNGLFEPYIEFGSVDSLVNRFESMTAHSISN